ncbi:MAG TPA: DNA-3-methyladenine glycosylase [Gemmatimonadaceae bacterium]|nr:DNA-3-methyladenine glycosylase [Gemmatimonadaceae bacterium]
MANHRTAVRHLKRADPVLAEIIERVGPCRLELRAEGTHFQALARSIVFQQLSGKAASTILSRFFALYPDRTPTPDAVLATPDDVLRAAGLSRQKIGYLRDLALKVSDDSLPLDAVEHMEDDDLIAHLVQVKGIGRWTAQMFLMFRLGRPDVLPELDLGIQNAIKRAYRKRKRPTPKDVKKFGARWRPYSTVACWYLWRSLDNGDGQLGAE